MIKNDSQAPSCTCPSGDGSLRHPCPAHPAVDQEDVAAKLTFINGRPAMCGCQVEYSDGGGEYSDVIYVTLCAKHSGSAILDLVGAFDEAPVEDITPSTIAQYRDARTAKVRANREITLLSFAYNMAREWGITSMENPCRGVKKNKEQPRDVYVTDEVWKALYEKAPDDLRVTMDLAYLTGQRPADVRKLRKNDVSGDYLLVGQNKTSRKLRIRLRRADGQMTQLGHLVESIASDSPALVTNEKGQPMTEKMLRTRFDTARKAAADEAIKAGDQDLAREIMQFQFRDIRPKAASDIESLADASDLLGHTTQEITKRVYRRIGKAVNPVR